MENLRFHLTLNPSPEKREGLLLPSPKRRGVGGEVICPVIFKSNMLRAIFFSLNLLFSTFSTQAQTSVLAKGDWYKIATTRSGVHKIDATFLKKIGIDVAKINPQNIRIFGNGGGTLPQANDVPRPSDLIENAIEVMGENDGKFDASDYLLFYSESPHKILYNADNQRFIHQNNPYSDSVFYFLNVSDTKGLRIKNH
jgi:hypothetical protein